MKTTGCSFIPSFLCLLDLLYALFDICLSVVKYCYSFWSFRSGEPSTFWVFILNIVFTFILGYKTFFNSFSTKELFYVIIS